MRRSAFLFLLVRCATTAKPDTIAPAKIALTPTNGVTFGTVNVGSTGTAVVNVVNSGASAATQIADASGGLGNFAYQGGSYPGNGGTCSSSLLVGVGCTLMIEFSPTAAGAAQATLTLGFFDGTQKQQSTLALSGTGAASETAFNPSEGANQAGVNNPLVDSLGTATTDASGTSQTLTATKNAEDDAITIIALSSDPTSELIVDDVFSPTNVNLTNFSFFDDDGDYTASELNRATYSTGATAMVIPQTPDIDGSQTPAGAYTFDISAFNPNATSQADFAVAGVSADVFVVHQLAPSTSAPLNHVDVNFFFSGSPGPSAAEAKASASFQQIVGNFVSLWGQGPGACDATPSVSTLGLCIDSINYIDLPSGYANIAGDFSEDLPGQEKDIVELFEQSAGVTPAGVNFFFVDSIELDGESSSSGAFVLLGVDGSIPSPGAFMGTPRSGALVVLDTIPSDANDIGQLGATIAHEGGHYLGLYHVQESDCQPDNLSDTPCDPSCTCTSTTGHGRHSSCATYGELSGDVPLAQACSSASDPGFDTLANTEGNVMYWEAAPNGYSAGSPLVFSVEQLTTTHRHPLIHN